MALQDYRSRAFTPIQGKIVCAGYKVNEQNVKEMLQFLGVRPTEEVIQEAIGYLSYHGLEINMINLFDFIKEKGYDKNRLDLRTKKN